MIIQRMEVLLSMMLVCALAGCTSTSRFALPDERIPLAEKVSIGQQLRIVTLDGTEHEITVEGISDSGVCGPDACYEYRELESISIETFSWLKTTATTVGAFIGMAAVAAASIGSVL